MKAPHLASEQKPHPRTTPVRIGCVSYLNAKPLIHGVPEQDWADVCFAVPSELLAGLEAGETDIALCPVIDYFRSDHDLQIVPAGAIGCDGPTLTVRLFSSVPLGQITTIQGDTDSHTSVALTRIIMKHRFGREVDVLPYPASHLHNTGYQQPNPSDEKYIHQPRPGELTQAGRVQAILLIGDKVINAGVDDAQFPWQLDLGEAWHDMTSLPFVFATWLTRKGADLGDAPSQLFRARIANAGRISRIAQTYAASHGWPVELAEQYLGSMLKYNVQQPQLDAISLFAKYAHELGLISQPRPLSLYDFKK